MNDPSSSSAGRLLQHFTYPPAFVPGQRARLDDHYAVALVALALLVVSLVTPALTQPFAIERMLEQAIHLHHHSLRHLGGDHHSFTFFSSFPHRSPWGRPVGQPCSFA